MIPVRHATRFGGEHDWLRATVVVAVWACTLPIVFMLVIPRLGLAMAIGVAGALLMGMGGVCWALRAFGCGRDAR